MTAPARNIPVALTIAGSDCSAGAGLQADLKTFSALGVYAVTAVTCVVAEVPGKVARIEPVDPQNVREQIELLLATFPVAAIKSGLLFSAAVVEIVATTIERRAAKLPLVVDPVMIATSGDSLLEPAAIELYQSRLFPISALITPNMPEAAALSGLPVRDLGEMRAAGKKLAAKYGTRILLKGGHLEGERAIDLLFDRATISEYSGPFVRGIATHGTGCTYSAAITAGLARGLSIDAAIARAKNFVSRAIRERFSWQGSLGQTHALNQMEGSH
jgi:hydroxymethylpyrimidine/phosphomethylpyrimidine kinase